MEAKIKVDQQFIDGVQLLVKLYEEYNPIDEGSKPKSLHEEIGLDDCPLCEYSGEFSAGTYTDEMIAALVSAGAPVDDCYCFHTLVTGVTCLKQPTYQKIEAASSRGELVIVLRERAKYLRELLEKVEALGSQDD